MLKSFSNRLYVSRNYATAQMAACLKGLLKSCARRAMQR